MYDSTKELIEQAKILTKSLAPQYPLGYYEIYQIVLSYLVECYVSDVEYKEEDLEDKIFTYCTLR